ncbi:MAG: Na(+)/H(+) antiporter subunit D [Opitutales bacterium]
MSGIPDLPPAVLLALAAVLLPVLPRLARAVLTVAVPLVALGMLLQFEHGPLVRTPFAGFELILLQVNSTNYVFGLIFLLISAAAGLYAWHLRDTTQQVAALLYGAGALGVTFAGDFFTLLIFWELMAVSSAWLVFARRQPDSTAAAFRYLLVHIVGGSILFAGIVVHYADTGSLLLGPLEPGGLASWLIFLGVAINVALPPFHAWLPDAYPKATVTGAIFMSALTTKSAVYIFVVLFTGWEFLAYWGMGMAVFGAIYAFLCNDIRQILAYHIVSQVGFMVAGVGVGTELAVNGTIAHAYSHILYKALLFMGAGAIIQATGKSKLTELGNLWRHLPGVAFLFMIGAVSISGVPFWNGFISKSMTISAAGYAHFEVVTLGLFLASVGTFLSIGLKIPFFAFWGPERNLKIEPIPRTMYAAMGVLAFLCTLYGVWPGLLYEILPHDKPYHPFTAYHFVETLQYLTLAFVGFWLVRHKVTPKEKIYLDTDWLFYRRTRPLAEMLVLTPVNAFFGAGVRLREAVVSSIARHWGNPRAWFQPASRSGDAFDPDTERAPLAHAVGFVLFFSVLLSLLFIAF